MQSSLNVVMQLNCRWMTILSILYARSAGLLIFVSTDGYLDKSVTDLENGSEENKSARTNFIKTPCIHTKISYQMSLLGSNCHLK